jgi:nucleotide-binding universal stress UspA family protein
MTEPVRRIVVAVDGSPNSRRALRRAADEATAHGASLEVVLAWGLLDQVTATQFDPNYGEARARADLEQIVAAELGENRPTSTALRIENDLPARAILAAAQGAWMVVVGSRGLGGFKGLLLGSRTTPRAPVAYLPLRYRKPAPTCPVPTPVRGLRASRARTKSAWG